MAEMSRARYSIATLKVEIFMDQFMPQFDPYEIVDSQEAISFKIFRLKAKRFGMASVFQSSLPKHLIDVNVTGFSGMADDH